MVCLDTTVLIDLSRRRGAGRAERAAAVIRQSVEGDGQITTTRFNVAELYVGVERLAGQARTEEEERVGLATVDLAILEFEAVAARIFARITAHLQGMGEPAGDMDVLIASVAIANNQALVTRNPKHFAHIPELSVLGY